MMNKPKITKEDMVHLDAIYGIAFIEAHYDPNTKESQEVARKIWEHIDALNQKWGFRK